MTRPTCKTCVYSDIKGTDSVGCCRFNPPSIRESGWPPVKTSDWCGRHRISEDHFKEWLLRDCSNCAHLGPTSTCLNRASDHYGNPANSDGVFACSMHQSKA